MQALMQVIQTMVFTIIMSSLKYKRLLRFMFENCDLCLKMIYNAPVVAVVGTDISVLTVLAIGVVNSVDVSLVAVETSGVVPVVVAAVLTVDSGAVVNVAGAVVLSTKHANEL